MGNVPFGSSSKRIIAAVDSRIVEIGQLPRERLSAAAIINPRASEASTDAFKNASAASQRNSCPLAALICSVRCRSPTITTRRGADIAQVTDGKSCCNDCRIEGSAISIKLYCCKLDLVGAD